MKVRSFTLKLEYGAINEISPMGSIVHWACASGAFADMKAPYHPGMRLLFLALMIVLLPVRGWMGDVMAMEMATSNVVAINKIAAYAHSTGSRGKFDINLAASRVECQDHAGMSMDMSDDVNGIDQESADPASHGPCTDCSACQICHTVALTVDIPRLAALAQHQALRPASGLQFASATTAPRLKPPIY